jgi:hypothetical protein
MRLNDGGRECGRGPARGFGGVLFAAAGCVLAAIALAGCGLSDGYGTLTVDPARYSAYHCKDLIAQRASLLKREQELRGLIDKANEGPGGGTIGTMAYRTDYETVLSEEKLLQRTAAEKNCELVPTYQSDQTVR